MRERSRGGVLGDERGSVVAEFAVALPAIGLVVLLAAGALGTTARQVRLQDVVADAARLASRGESARAHEVVAGAVPGASAEVTARGDLLCVTATAPAPLPLTLAATSCALAGGY